MPRNAELLFVMAACLLPLFLFANTINDDEFKKSGLSLVLAGPVVGYRLWRTCRGAGDDDTAAPLDRELELLIVVGACLSPMYLWADQIGFDELKKSGLTVAVLIVYRIWSGQDPTTHIDSD